jgi:hypothetical protein
MLSERTVEIGRRRWKWTRRRVLLTTLAACGAVVLIFLHLLLHDPSWYEPPIIPTAEQQQVRNNLVAAEQAFTESLRAGNGPFVYHIYQDDVNRWLAMRREIYPLLDELAPPELADPFVIFDAGRITLAGRYRDGAVEAVISIDLDVAMRADALTLTVAAARLGSVRMPLRIARSLGLDEPVDREPNETWPGSPRIQGSPAAGLQVGSEARWKNGGVAYRVLDVVVNRGRIDITIEPHGRQEGSTGRKRH